MNATENFINKKFLLYVIKNEISLNDVTNEELTNN